MKIYLSAAAAAFLAGAGLAGAQSDQLGGQSQEITNGGANSSSIGSGIASDGTMEKLPDAQKPVKPKPGSQPMAVPGTTATPKPGTPGTANADGTGTSHY